MLRLGTRGFPGNLDDENCITASGTIEKRSKDPALGRNLLALEELLLLLVVMVDIVQKRQPHNTRGKHGRQL